MKENMKEALKYFQEIGIPTHNGYIDSKLSNEQIDTLIKWKEATSVGENQMPKLEDFYKSILLASSLQPQKDINGNVQYLFGKEIGTQIALIGNIKGRKQYNIEIPYNSYSKFELYDSTCNYGESFKRLYGNEEAFPPTRTKALDNIPEGYMDCTCEKVYIEGYEFLVPQLELMFIDSFITKESTPREGLYDAEWLAYKYDLDKDLIKDYLQNYYFKSDIQNSQNDIDSLKVSYYDQLKEMFERVESERGKLDINAYAGIAYDKKTIGTIENAIDALKLQELLQEQETKDNEGGLEINE